MNRYLLTSLLTGLLFGILDGLINGNAYAVQLMDSFKPIARTEINLIAGIVIDLLYGFAICGVYMLIRPALTASSTVVNGLTFGLGMWFFRVLMHVMSYWMMFTVPIETLLYLLVSGLAEMLCIGLFAAAMLHKKV